MLPTKLACPFVFPLLRFSSALLFGVLLAKGACPAWFLALLLSTNMLLILGLQAVRWQGLPQTSLSENHRLNILYSVCLAGWAMVALTLERKGLKAGLFQIPYAILALLQLSLFFKHLKRLCPSLLLAFRALPAVKS